MYMYLVIGRMEKPKKTSYYLYRTFKSALELAKMQLLMQADYDDWFEFDHENSRIGADSAYLTTKDPVNEWTYEVKKLEVQYDWLYDKE